jgi:hypothetical protein
MRLFARGDKFVSWDFPGVLANPKTRDIELIKNVLYTARELK